MMAHPDDMGPLATMADAHLEWHRNSGLPVGYPGCPQDACHLPDPDPEVSMACGYCHTRHWGHDRAEVIEQIKACSLEAARARANDARRAAK